MGTIALQNAFKLHNVLFVPNFIFHLIFVVNLIEDLTCKVWFSTNECFMQRSLMKKPILLSREKKVLYTMWRIKTTQNLWMLTLPILLERVDWSMTSKSSISDLGTSHFIAHNYYFLILKILNQLKSKIHCFVQFFPLAKQSRLTFNSNSKKTSDVFQLLTLMFRLHWGIFQDIEVLCSIITIVYDFSRFTWVFLMK